MAFGEGFSGQQYEQSHGADLYRRGMYTLWKRTVPPASLATFDAPYREKCTARRAQTNTPLQALALMNDPTYVEAARALAAARRCSKAGADPDAPPRLRLPPRDGAPADRAARSRCSRGLLDERLRRVRDRTAPRRVKLLAVGESPRDAALEPGRARGLDDRRQRDPESRRRRSRSSRAMTIIATSISHCTRRQLFGLTAQGIGGAALGSLLGRDLLASASEARRQRAADRRCPACRTSRRRPSGSSSCTSPAAPRSSRRSTTSRSSRSSRARRFPDSVRKGQRVAADDGAVVAAGRALALRVRAARASRARGSASCCRTPRRSSTTSRVIRTMNTEAINHDPAITFIQTGFQQPGRPSMGAWLSYGLGSENQNLPAFVVLLSQAHAINADQPLFSRLWGERLPAVQLSGRALRHAAATPVLYLDDPPGVSTRRPAAQMLDAIDRAEHDASTRPTAIRRSRPGSRSTRWPTGCRRRCRT